MTPKERPILFSGEMIRAILDGRKTQTRRVGGWQKDDATELGVRYIGHATKGMVALATYRAFPKGGTARHALCQCPYGIPGDRLWVRETWCPQIDVFGNATDRDPFYREGHPDLPSGHKWKPSIFMPRWASRITLEIVSVRVERLNDISAKDAIAEGWRRESHLYPNINTKDKALLWYLHLWNSLNAASGFGWEKNPWVWVIEFSKLQTPNQKTYGKKTNQQKK